MWTNEMKIKIWNENQNQYKNKNKNDMKWNKYELKKKTTIEIKWK